MLLALIAGLATAHAATRPRYGGTLRVELQSWTQSLDPSEAGDSPAKEKLSALVFEPLVRLDEQSVPRPALAVSWEPERDRKRWLYRLRPGVRFHDGMMLTGAAVAASLEMLGAAAQGDMAVSVAASPNEVASRVIWRRGLDGTLQGAGPFRLKHWEPGRRAQFSAYDDYWGGRPFVDEVHVEMGRTSRDALLDLELEKADAAELSVGDARRARRTAVARPTELMALVFSSNDAALREAVALSIDRGAMHNVLLQKQGAITGALLPQWLSGYAFLFPASRDLARARDLRPSRALALGYDPLDPLARSVAERIVVNAREAGVTVRVPAPGGVADARLLRARFASTDPAGALLELAAGLNLPVRARPGASPEALFAAERALLDGYRVAPLFHLPEIFGLSPAVRGWSGWTLENVWLAGRPTP